MAVASNSASKTKLSSPQKKGAKVTKKIDQAAAVAEENAQQPKRIKSPGVRVIGARIYDSENGKTCHQCRQKTMDFVASCKNPKGGKICTLNVCHKCLLNRYGEKAEEVNLLDDWTCPKCRGICNCSFCMKKRGHKPTGILVHAAKATGFSSASEMILVKGPDNLGLDRSVKRTVVSPIKSVILNKEPESRVVSPTKLGKENSFDGNADANLGPINLAPISSEKKSKKTKREGLKEIGNADKVAGDCSTQSSPKRSKVSAKKSEKKIKTIKDNCVTMETKSTKKRVSDEVSLQSIKPEDDGNKNNDVKGKEKMSVKKIKTGKDDCVLVGKKSSKKRALDEVSLQPIKPEDAGKNDVGIAQDAGVLNSSKDMNVKAKIRKTKVSEQSLEIKKCATNLEQAEVEDVPLPQGTLLTTVWGFELSPEDVGHALQFLEFCLTFGKVLDVRNGQAQAILRELKRGSSFRRGQYSSAIRFHTQLLSLIQEDTSEESSSISSKNSWLQALEKCISESECVSEELSACFGKGVKGYAGLDFSKKLRILNFLCDEVLCTTKLRSWIGEENSKLVEKEKESKEKVAAAKSKEKLLKQKMQDELAAAIVAKNGAPLSISEHEAIVSQIKSDVAEAHAEILKAMGIVTKSRRRSDAVRTEPKFSDADGHVFWKLRCCGGELDMLLQDMGTSVVDSSAEKWFAYGSNVKEEIEKYISSKRAKWARSQSFARHLTSQADFVNPETEICA
ncbi:uncharacterized protein LOC133817742 [Humulus lupulus]|uniref:uncharacterized protein LOC133817742 n=1 Tax=Humulus lupulus TaxID=3486 RepID=UPI002B40ADA2|nr:uncharacterized protein LOC133817742 [Humulus lupulus]